MGPRTLHPLAALKWRSLCGKLRSPPSTVRKAPLHTLATNRGRRFAHGRPRPSGACRTPCATRHPPFAHSATVLVRATALATTRPAPASALARKRRAARRTVASVRSHRAIAAPTLERGSLSSGDEHPKLGENINLGPPRAAAAVASALQDLV